jgi:hypothetical protein
MSYSWPNHPLFNELCEQSSRMLPSLGFDQYIVKESIISYTSKDGMTISIQHEGYDMPSVFIGNKENPTICTSGGLIEYFIDKTTPIYKKHLELKSFYNFEFHFNLIETYNLKILDIIMSPKQYLEWENTIDIEKTFELINS